MDNLSPIMAVAIRARRDALSIGTATASLVASNTSDVVRNINAVSAGAIFNAIQIALAERLCMITARAFAPHWPNDLHLRSGFILLDEGCTDGLGSQEQVGALAVLVPRFKSLAEDPRCERLTYYRHKFVAHYGSADPAKLLPAMQDLYSFSELTAELMDDFAHAAGVLGPRFRPAQPIDTREAVVFWSRWAETEQRSL